MAVARLLAALTARVFNSITPRRCSREPLGWPRFPPLPAEGCLLPTPLPTIGSVYGDDGPCPISDLRRSHGTGEERVAEARHSCKFRAFGHVALADSGAPR